MGDVATLTWSEPCPLCGADATWSQQYNQPNVSVVCPRCDESMSLIDQVRRRIALRNIDPSIYFPRRTA